MKMFKQENHEKTFPFVAYIPDSISEHPALFAAIVPCCGGGIAAYAWALKDMPIWAFHGLDDTIVLPNQTIEMVEALKGVNPHLKYDLLEGVDHDLSSKAITEQTLAWMLSQKLAR